MPETVLDPMDSELKKGTCHAYDNNYREERLG